ncbi:MAG: DUF799 domain-containing protein [Pseudomonadales bacterium]|nr:DUF799 domain-containing protein [Pseudomonadales bacterium]
MNKPINMTLSKKVIFLLPILVSILSGCVSQPPYDYSALIQSKPRSIVVIPPMNNTVEVNAQYKFLSTISKPLADKGYYVFPVSVIDHFLKENGLPTPAEMNSIPLDKIGEIIGADAVLYVSIDQWGQKFQLISSKAIVGAKLRLVDVKTGAQLWDAKVYAEKASGDGGGGIMGALVAAVVEQVSGSIKDQTVGLSRTANNMAINSHRRGLLDGPYRPVSP